jgi:putative tricarboxylic transport membrane protein
MRAYRSKCRAHLAVGNVVAAAVLVVPMLSVGAGEQWKPDQNVEIVVPTTPGAGSDVVGRFVQRMLTEKKIVEVPVTVVNKPGGAAAIAIMYINQHPGNGHYFAVVNPAILTSNITGATTVKYTDTTPLAQVGTESVVFAVRSESSVKTASDLADRFKVDSSSISVAVANSRGNQNHIAAVQVAKAVGASIKNMKVVVFNGSGESVTALLGGHVDVVAIAASPLLQLYSAGKVRVLAVSAERRLGGVLSSVPTWKELGIESVSSNWRCLVGPRGMTEEQIRYWDATFSRMVQLPEWKADLEEKLVENTYLNARDTRKQMDVENAELTKLLGELGLAK